MRQPHLAVEAGSAGSHETRPDRDAVTVRARAELTGTKTFTASQKRLSGNQEVIACADAALYVPVTLREQGWRTCASAGHLPAAV
jgi:hypothetical protein